MGSAFPPASLCCIDDVAPSGVALAAPPGPEPPDVMELEASAPRLAVAFAVGAELEPQDTTRIGAASAAQTDRKRKTLTLVF